MAARFFNTMTRRLEEFRPLEAGKVRMYTCGPTVYDFAHIGNYRAYCFEDLLRRYLKFKGYDVYQVMNITDVEDKIIRSAKERGIPISAHTPRYIDAFFEDLDSLHIERAEIYPRATEHIPEMVALIKTLLDGGYGYRSEDGSIYFNIANFPGYGKLAHIEVDELRAGARVKQDDYEKESASDFALWKAWDDDDADTFWETELGKGRPGWHIECTAMSMKYLGMTFDIHTGGVDNIFPHHENEIAQSEAATGATFVKYWLHCEHLLVDNRKMAKRDGNFYTLRDVAEKGFNPMAVRYLYISTHYRSKLNFTFGALEAAQNTLNGVRDFLLRQAQLPPSIPPNPAIDGIIEKCRGEFEKGLDDDLNSPEALAAFFNFISAINVEAEAGKMGRGDGEKVRSFIFALDSVLGFQLDKAGRVEDVDADIQALLDERQAARKSRDFTRSDEIRDLLKERGILLEDTPGGVRWKKIR